MCKKYTLCIGVIITLCGMLGPLYADWGWEQNDYQLTDNTTTDRTSMNHAWSIAVSKPSSDHYVHVVWAQDDTMPLLNMQIHYRRNTDYGASASWQTEKKISENVYQCGEPSVAAANNYVYAVWHVFNDPEYTVYFNRSTNSGADWGSPTALGIDSSSIYPSIAASDSFVHLVWKYNVGGAIYYTRSSNYGENWLQKIRIGGAPAISRPSIAASDSYVHVVWHKYAADPEIFYKRSTDNGASWSDSIRLSSDNDTASAFPSVAAYGNYVNVVWKEAVLRAPGTAYEIYYARNTNYGSGRWSTSQISDDHGSNTNQVHNPSIAGADSCVYVVWQDERHADPPNNYNSEIYYNRSSDNGSNWLGTGDARLTYNIAQSHFPSVATLDTFAYVVWTDDQPAARPPLNEIFFQRYFKQSRGNRGGGFDVLNASAISSGVKFGGHVLAVSPITFRIYDVAGREVSSFVHRPVSTEFSYFWKPDNLSSGVYFVRASQKDGYQAKAKIVWVK